MKAKSTHGGKRAGAGRKTDPDSIRSQLAKEKKRVAEFAARGKRPVNSGATFYSIWAHAFLRKQTNPIMQLIHILHGAPDKSLCGITVEGDQKGFISLHMAISLSKLDEDLQWHFLNPAIDRFVAQYKDDDGCFGDRAREILKARS
jgi:hypothetical protein